jgi:hypothetical protein
MTEKHHMDEAVMCWRFSRNRFVYVSRRGGAQGIQCLKPVQGGNLVARPSCMAGWPDKWGPRAKSSATCIAQIFEKNRIL